MQRLSPHPASFVSSRLLPWCAALLFGIRFAAPSISAALAVQGFDTTAMGVVFQLYGAILPAVAAILIALILATWPNAGRANGGMLFALALTASSIVLWAGELNPSYRLVGGPWAGLPLGVSVSATILMYGTGLERWVGRAATARLQGEGLRALYGGFAIAYLLASLRFIDYRSALGAALPSGVLWLLDYGPILLLCTLSVAFWIRLTVWPEPTVTGRLRTLPLPFGGAVVGLLASLGLGGYILSNALAWGGAYEVFVPTELSLAFVGFAVGCFLATARGLRRTVPAARWRLLAAGVSVTAFGGILFFDGAMVSLAGILLGLTLAARGTADQAGLAPVDIEAIPHERP